MEEPPPYPHHGGSVGSPNAPNSGGSSQQLLAGAPTQRYPLARTQGAILTSPDEGGEGRWSFLS